jgi:hypothetical protein
MANEVRVDIPNAVVANHGASVYDRYKKTVAVSMLAASVAAVLVTLAASRGMKLTPETQVPISTVHAARKISKLVDSNKPLGVKGALSNVISTRKNIHVTSATREEIVNILAASIGRDLSRLPALGARTLEPLLAPFVTLFSRAKP